MTARRASGSRCSPGRSPRPTRPGADLPWLVFLQGGPGFGAPRPHRPRQLAGPRAARLPGAAARPARHRPLHPGQPADAGPARHAPGPGGYLAHFRADAIVRDAELVRRQLTGGEPWSVLGQSFGGFCTVTYLSLAPGGHPRGVHHRRPARPGHHRRRPLPAHLPQGRGQEPGALRALPGRRGAGPPDRPAPARPPGGAPGGAPLTVEAFQSLGQMLGTSTGSDELHYLIEDPFAGGELSDAFLHAVQPHSALRQRRCTRCCTRRVTRRAPPPAGRRTGSGPSSGEFDAGRRPRRRRPAAVHRRDDLPVDVRGRPGAAPAAEAAELLAERGLAPALRPGPARRQRRAGRGGDVLQRHVRAAGVLGADRAGDPRPDAPG